MKLSNLRVGVRLSAAFGVVCLLLVAIIGSAVLSSHAQGTQRKDLAVASDLRAASLAAKFRTADFNGWQTAYALDANLGTANATSDQGTSRKSFLDSAAAFRSDLDRVRAFDLSNSEKVDVDAAQSAFDEFMKLDETVIADYRAANEGQQKAANDLVLGEELRLFAKIADSMDGLATETEHAAASAQLTADHESTQTTRFLIGLGVVALLFAAALSLLITRSITSPLDKMVRALRRVADGDLTTRARLEGRDELAQMASTLDTAVASVQATMISTTEAATMVASAAEELTAVSAGLSDQASMMAAATEEMGSTIEEIARNTAAVSTTSQDAVVTASSANQTIEQLVESSHRIGQVVEVITSIADQTNLLALNATIEAARAGESGKGFAVVATEVKTLAQSTSNSTSEIEAAVQGIQHGTRTALEGIEEIVSVVSRVSEIQSSISAAVTEQSAAASEIGQGAEMTSASASQTASAAAELTQLASQLQDLVGQFRVDARTR